MSDAERAEESAEILKWRITGRTGGREGCPMPNAGCATSALKHRPSRLEGRKEQGSPSEFESQPIHQSKWALTLRRVR